MELKEGWNPESVLHTFCSVIVNHGRRRRRAGFGIKNGQKIDKRPYFR